MPGTLILDHYQIRQKIVRMAAEIWENNFNNTQINLAGIEKNGFLLAKLLRLELEKLNAQNVQLFEIKLNKKSPLLDNVEIAPTDGLLGSSVILVDDVLNTGKTFSFALAALLAKGVERISSAVLVNRSHKNFPVHANYVGLSLATTLEDHVSVVLDENNYAAYLD